MIRTSKEQSLRAGESILPAPVAWWGVTTHDEPSPIIRSRHTDAQAQRRGPDDLFDTSISIDPFRPCYSTVHPYPSLQPVQRGRERGIKQHYLSIMAITPKIPFSDLLSMIVLLLVHPSLARIRHAAVRLAPVEVLACVRALVARAVLEALVCGSEMLSVRRSIVGELVVPDEGGASVAGLLGSFVAGCEPARLVRIQIFCRRDARKGRGDPNGESIEGNIEPDLWVEHCREP